MPPPASVDRAGRSTIAEDVGKCDTDVMVNDTMLLPGAIAPPGSSPPPALPERGRLLSMNEHDLRAFLTRFLADIRPDLPGGPTGADGTCAVSSQIAVSLLGVIGGIVGKEPLANLRSLSTEQKAELRTVGGVARIMRRALQGVPR